MIRLYVEVIILAIQEIDKMLNEATESNEKTDKIVPHTRCIFELCVDKF